MSTPINFSNSWPGSLDWKHQHMEMSWSLISNKSNAEWWNHKIIIIIIKRTRIKNINKLEDNYIFYDEIENKNKFNKGIKKLKEWKPN
jgi:hypothetical protein